MFVSFLIELIQKILKDILPTEEEVLVEEPNSQNEIQITEDDVWELLKKVVKKDKSILLKIISKSN